MSTDSEPPPASRTIKATEFKAKCLKLMDEVAESGEEIIITKNGKPVAKLTPYREEPSVPTPQIRESMYGKDRGKIRILGDIVSPMPAEWFTDPDDSGEVTLLRLLDTHVLVWFREANPRLGNQAREDIDRAFREGDAAVSVISYWEITMRMQKGRIQLPSYPTAHGFRVLAQGLAGERPSGNSRERGHCYEGRTTDQYARRPLRPPHCRHGAGRPRACHRRRAHFDMARPTTALGRPTVRGRGSRSPLVADQPDPCVRALHPEQRPELVARCLHCFPAPLVAVHQGHGVGYAATISFR